MRQELEALREQMKAMMLTQKIMIICVASFSRQRRTEFEI